MRMEEMPKAVLVGGTAKSVTLSGGAALHASQEASRQFLRRNE